MSKEAPLLKLKDGLEKFKEDSAKHGWEGEEVDEKVAEAFENFPWYKYKGGEKRTYKSILWKLCLFSLFVYMAGGAYLERNRRLKKHINDYIFDLDMSYHSARISRWLSLPLTQYLDLAFWYKYDCLMNNPFFKAESIKCEFCENITSIPSIMISNESIDEMILNGEPFILSDVPGYSNTNIGFNSFKHLFMNHPMDMDDAICEIYESTEYRRMSDYFKLTEEEVNEKKISLGWRNCDGYGARFYRKLFTRPSFVSNVTEIMLEKVVYMLQPGKDFVVKDQFPQGSTYIFQVQGESVISFSVHTDCHKRCIVEPINVNLKAGQMVIYPNDGWNVTAKVVGERLGITYLSAFMSNGL